MKKIVKKPRNLDKTDENKYNLLIALEKNLGNITKACKAVKVARSQFYVYLESDTEFKEKVKEIEEANLDFVESKMYERIKGYTHKETKVFQYKGQIITQEVTKYYPPDSRLIQFFLETKGAERGYLKKQLNINVDENDPFKDMTDEELANYITSNGIGDVISKRTNTEKPAK